MRRLPSYLTPHQAAVEFLKSCVRALPIAVSRAEIDLIPVVLDEYEARQYNRVFGKLVCCPGDLFARTKLGPLKASLFGVRVPSSITRWAWE